MAGKLVTIARFDLAGQAHLAKNALDAAGIRATLADEALVAMDWLLSTAVGGIKVQVLEEDADRAVEVLEQALGSDPGPVDEEALAAEAEAAGEADAIEAPEPESPAATVTGAPPDDVPEGPTPRDEDARRFVLAAFFGLAIAPLWFYALYLFFNAAFGFGPISPRGTRKLVLGVFLLALGFVPMWFLVWYYGHPFS